MGGLQGRPISGRRYSRIRRQRPRLWAKLLQLLLAFSWLLFGVVALAPLVVA